MKDSLYNWEELDDELELGVPYIVDHTGLISKSLGVYATPQAAILTSEQTLYYRGNYNRGKYCTDPTSSFAQQALDSLLANVPAPSYGIVA